METSEHRVIRCVPYTKAKRYPMMVGDFWGYTSWPLPLTVFQLLALVISAAAMGISRPVWAHFGLVNFLVFPSVVLGAMYAARQVRIEGRAPWAAGLGLAGSITGRPRINGRPFKARTVTKFQTAKIQLVPGVEWKRYLIAIHRAPECSVSGKVRLHGHWGWWVRRES